MRWCIDLKLFLVRRCDDMYEKMWWSLREDAKISHIFYRFAPGRLKKWKWKKWKISGKSAHHLLSVRIDMQIRWSGPLNFSRCTKPKIERSAFHIGSVLEKDFWPIVPTLRSVRKLKYSKVTSCRRLTVFRLHALYWVGWSYLEVLFLHQKPLFGGTVPPPKKLFGDTIHTNIFFGGGTLMEISFW